MLWFVVYFDFIKSAEFITKRKEKNNNSNVSRKEKKNILDEWNKEILLTFSVTKPKEEEKSNVRMNFNCVKPIYRICKFGLKMR